MRCLDTQATPERRMRAMEIINRNLACLATHQAQVSGNEALQEAVVGAILIYRWAVLAFLQEIWLRCRH